MTSGTVATRTILTVLSALVLFGIAYNALVAWMERKGHDRGFTAFLVVGGTLVTLAGGIFLVGLEPVLWLLACFAASGLPMVIGSWARYAKARRADEGEVLRLAKEAAHATPEGSRLPVEPGVD